MISHQTLLCTIHISSVSVLLCSELSEQRGNMQKWIILRSQRQSGSGRGLSAWGSTCLLEAASQNLFLRGGRSLADILKGSHAATTQNYVRNPKPPNFWQISQKAVVVQLELQSSRTKATESSADVLKGSRAASRTGRPRNFAFQRRLMFVRCIKRQSCCFQNCRRTKNSFSETANLYQVS